MDFLSQKIGFLTNKCEKSVLFAARGKIWTLENFYYIFMLQTEQVNFLAQLMLTRIQPFFLKYGLFCVIN